MHVRRQVRQELSARIVRRDDDRVGHNVLGHHRIETDLRDDSVKDFAREGIDCKTGRLVGMDLPDVGFIHRRPELQPFKVLGDQEEARSAQAGTTVWPMLTRRSMMTPFTGETIVVYRRLV